MKIFVLGFMGSGKTTYGRELAENLEMDFVDLDAYIEEKSGKSILQIFEKEGEEAFRELESKYILELFSLENTLIATGGGTACHDNLVDRMNEQGLTIFLKVPADELHKRLKKERKRRPLIKNMREKPLRAYINVLLKERIHCYHKAKMVVYPRLLGAGKLAKQIALKMHKQAG